MSEVQLDVNGSCSGGAASPSEVLGSIGGVHAGPEVSGVVRFEREGLSLG